MIATFRKLFRNLTIWTLIFLLGPWSFISCSNDLFGMAEPVSISIDKTLLEFESLTAADSIQTLKAEVKTKGNQVTTNIKWNIEPIGGSKESGIQIMSSSNGVFQFRIKEAGEYRIVAVCSDKTSLTASCVVRVKGYLEELKIAKDDETIVDGNISCIVGTEFKLTPVFIPSSTSQTDVLWSVEDESILTINKTTGEVKAKEAGSTVVTLRSASNSEIYTTVNVLVKAAINEQEGAASSITLTPNGIMEIPVGTFNSNSYKILATIKDPYQNTVVEGDVTWVSSNEEAVTITDINGREAYVNASGKGEAEITANFKDPRYEKSQEISAKLTVRVTGALEGLSTDAETYSFPTGYNSELSEGENPGIKVYFTPENTIETDFEVKVDDKSIASVNKSSDSNRLNVITFDKEGSTTVTLTSTKYKDITKTFTINVNDPVTDADRINKIEMSSSALTIEPPFESNSKKINVTTWVYDGKDGSIVKGDPNVFSVKLEAENKDLVDITSNRDGSFTIKGKMPGETKLTATSELNPLHSVSIPLTVRGELDGLIIGSSRYSFTLGTTKVVTVSANPWNAIITDEEDGEGARISVKTKTDSILKAYVGVADDLSNKINITLEGLVPGEETVTVFADEEEMGSFEVAVLPQEGYISKLAFNTSSVSMRQDSDGTGLTLEAVDLDGETVKIDEDLVVFELVENGKIIEQNDFDESEILNNISINETEGKIYFAPKNSGVVLLRAYAAKNPLASTECRIEVGGAATKGEGLSKIIPESEYFQIQKNGSVSTKVNFIPSDYYNKEVTWEHVDEEPMQKNVEIIKGSNGNVVTVKGVETGKDTILATVDGTSVNTLINIEVVDGDAYSIKLDRNYLSFDRNQKADPVITATVYKNGVVDNSKRIKWEIDEDFGSNFISISQSGARGQMASVHLIDNDELGTAMVRATIEGVDNVTSSCLVEVIDSYSLLSAPRSITLQYASVIIEKGEKLPVTYKVLPEEALPNTELMFSYGVNTVVSATLNDDNESFVIEGLNVGKDTITVSAIDKNNDEQVRITDTIDVTVVERTAVPSEIKIEIDGVERNVNQSINLSQEKMDSFVSIKATVLDQNGEEYKGTEKISFATGSGASRYFLSKNSESEIDTTKQPSDGVEYWGDTEVAENEVRIKPVGAGTSYIKVEYPGLDAVTLTVTVAAEEAIYQEGVEELLASASKVVIETGKSSDVYVTPVPDNDLDKEIKWESKNTDIATVKADNTDTRFARISGVKEGETTVTATLTDGERQVSAIFSVTVADDISNLITGISLVPQNIVLDLDAKDLTQLSATVYKGGKAVSDENVTWTVDEVLTNADAEGKKALSSVTENINSTNTLLNIEKGDKEATGYITVTSAKDEDFFAKAYVSVVRSSTLEKVLSRVLLNAESKEMEIGETFNIIASPIPSSIATDPALEFAYKSSNDKVASVDNNGKVTAHKAGRATITVTGLYNDKTVEAYLDVTVLAKNNAVSIKLDKNAVIFNTTADPAVTVNVSVFDKDNNDITDETEFVWSVEDSSVASITADKNDSSKATITAKQMDKATKFTVTDGSISAEGMIIVGEVDELVGLIVNPASINLSVNDSSDVSLSLIPENISGKFTIQSSVNNDRVSVDTTQNPNKTNEFTAEISAKKEGNATITFDVYEYGRPTGISATLNVNVSGVAVARRIVLDRDMVDFSKSGDSVEVKAYIESNTGNKFKEGEAFVSWSLESGDADFASMKVSDTDKNTVTVERGTGSGEAELIATYDTLKASIPVVKTSKGESSATSPTALSAKNRQVILYHPNTTGDGVTDADKKATLQVVYTPLNLSEDYKDIDWQIVKPGIIQMDADAGQTTLYSEDGTFKIKAIGSGTTDVIATSSFNPNVKTTFTVSVLPEGQKLEGGIPEVTVDVQNIELEKGGDSVRVTARVTNDEGEVSDYTKLSWETKKQDLVTIQRIDSKSRSITSQDKVGYDTLSVKYLVASGATADEDIYTGVEIPISVIDSSVAGQPLRSITINEKNLVMLTGQTENVSYSVSPDIPVDLTFSYSSDGIVDIKESDRLSSTLEISALKEGEVTVEITAKEKGNNDSDAVKNTMKITVSNTVLASTRFASFEPSVASLKFMPSDPATLIEYTLTELESGDEDVSTDIYEIKVTGINGKVLQTITSDEMKRADGKDVDAEDNNIFKISWVGGSNTRSIKIEPVAPGSAFIDVTVMDDPDSNRGITARTFITVDGALKSVALPTDYIHMAIGDSEVIKVNFNPGSAVINDGEEYFEWTAVAEGESGTGGTLPANSYINLSQETARDVVVYATNVGKTTLTYSYDIDGINGPEEPIESEIVIVVDPRDSLSGGARKVAFDSSYMEIPYPYNRQNVAATITYYDNSTTSAGVEYGLLKKGVDGQDMKFENIESDINNLEVSNKYASIMVASGEGESGVYITPLSAGEVTLVAYYKDSAGNDHIAKMKLFIEGAVSKIITSNSSIVLYTGGSMVLTASPDDTSAPGIQFKWTPDAALSDAIETPITLNNTNGSSVVVAAKDVISDPNNPLYDDTLAKEYPKSGKITISMPQYPGVSETIDVTVELLPAENTYPKSIELASTRLTLEPDGTTGFVEDLEMSATVLDRDGEEVSATIDWYYYPISKNYDWTKLADDAAADEKAFKFISWIDPADVSTNDYISAYMQEDTSVLYYKPQSAGQYRLKAVVRENPILQAECTINVGGDVRGISASTGANLELIKDQTQVINTVFTPDNALARTVFFIPEEMKQLVNKETLTSEESAMVNTKTDKYSFTQNGSSISLRANELTTESILYIEYWDTDVTGALNQAKNTRGEITAADYKAETEGKEPLHSYPITIRISPKEKTIITFQVNGLDSAIDPSKIESNISFSVSATSVGGETSTQFENWDWVEVDIVGAESNYVYATSRMIDDPEDKTSPEGQKKKVADWQYYKDWRDQGAGFTPSLEQPIAVNGRLFRDQNTFSFQLNQGGLTTEYLYVVVRLIPEYADGYKDGVSAEEAEKNPDEGLVVGEYIFNDETLGFNEGKKLVTIGGAVTEIGAGEVYFNLNGNDNLSAPAGTTNIDLILGASARLTVTYNPTYTHQKGVFWYVTSGNFDDFEALKGENGSNQCSVFARTQTDTPVVLRAVSLYDPWFAKKEEKYGKGWLAEFMTKASSERNDEKWALPKTEELSKGLYLDYQITVRSPIQNAKFDAYSQTRVNDLEDDSGYPQTALYDFLNEKDYPSTSGDNEIWCYDTVGASGSLEDAEKMNPVDAYYIKATLEPDYDYQLEYRIIDGADIGSIDYTEIDRGNNEFRFVPRGIVKDVIGNGYSINYGDVTIEAYNNTVNYSKNFVLHYVPSNMKLVKYIGSKERKTPFEDMEMSDLSNVPDEWQTGVVFKTDGSYEVDLEKSGEWDVYTPDSGLASLYGLEALVLYPGETFNLALVSFFNSVPQYTTGADGMYENVDEYQNGKESTKYAIQFAVKANQEPNMNKLRPGYIDFESGFFQDEYGEGTLPERAGTKNDSEYLTDKTNDTGISEWYYDDQSLTITAKKQGVVFLQYSLAPIVDPPLDEATGIDREPYADTENKITSGVWVYIVDPVDQTLAQVVQRNENYGQFNLSALIPYKISLAQLTAKDADGNSLPSHWFMGVKGAAIERAVDGEGEELSDMLYRGRAYGSFSSDATSGESLNIPLDKFKGGSGNAMDIFSLKTEILIAPQMISEMNNEFATSDFLTFVNDVDMTDIGFFGDWGINRFKGVKEVTVNEDGTMTKEFLIENGNGTLDLSGLNVTRYTHTGLALDDTIGFEEDSTVADAVKKIKPPHNIEYLNLSGNGLDSEFIWEGTISGTTIAYNAKESLVELVIDNNEFKNLTLEGFTNLRSVSAAGGNFFDPFYEGERYLNILNPDSSKLVQLNVDNTIFNHVIADFEKGKGRDEFRDIGLVRDGFVSILSARSENMSGASGSLKTISVSGAIGYADVSMAPGLQSFIHSAEVKKNTKDYFVASDTYENYIQVLNFGGSDNLPDEIELAYEDAYTDEEGIFKADSMNPGVLYSSLGPGNSLGTFQVNTVGYLKNNPTRPKMITSFHVSRVERLDGGENYAADEDFVDFNLSNFTNLSLKTLTIGEIAANTYAAFDSSIAFTTVNADKVFGTLGLRDNRNLQTVNVNTKTSSVDSVSGSRVVLDGSDISDLSKLNIKAERLDLNNMPELTEIDISNTSPLTSLAVLHANYTGEVEEPGDIPESGNIEVLNIGSASNLVELECYGGQSLKEVNIQGQKLKHIDLHDAGLYKQKWRIGTFEFISNASPESISGLQWNYVPGMPTRNSSGLANGSNMYGMALSNDTYSDFKLTDITYEQAGTRQSCSGSGDDRECHDVAAYDYFYEVEGTKNNVDNGAKVVDWKTWLPGLAEDDATLVMYGNNINFRYFIGAQNITMGAAYDQGIIPMPEFEFREFKFRMPKEGWLRNDVSMSSADSEEFSELRNSSYISSLGFGYSTLDNYNASDFPRYNDANYLSDREMSVTVYYAWSKEELEKKLEDQESFDASRFIELLTKYYTYYPAGGEFVKTSSSAQDFVDHWKEAPFVSTGRNSVTSATFQIRFGTLPQEAYNSKKGQYVIDGNYMKTPLIVHQKHKGKAGLFGLLSQASEGYIQLSSVENASVNGSKNLSYFKYKQDTQYREVYISEKGDISGYYTTYITQDGEKVPVDGLLCKYYMYDQYTKSAGHYGLVLIFPFG